MGSHSTCPPSHPENTQQPGAFHPIPEKLLHHSVSPQPFPSLKRPSPKALRSAGLSAQRVRTGLVSPGSGMSQEAPLPLPQPQAEGGREGGQEEGLGLKLWAGEGRVATPNAAAKQFTYNGSLDPPSLPVWGDSYCRPHFTGKEANSVSVGGLSGVKYQVFCSCFTLGDFFFFFEAAWKEL